MSGICGIVHMAGDRAEDGVLRTVLAAGTYGRSEARIWRQGAVVLAGPPDAFSRSSAFIEDGAATSAHDAASASGRSGIPGAPFVLADGRLDGRAELIDELRSASHRFESAFLSRLETAHDADLIGAAHVVWGDDAPNHLVGDYAYLVWDPDRRRLLCVRDALGMRPLHMTWTPGRRAFILASEARMIAAHPDVPLQLDEIAAATHLAGRMPDDGRTILAGIRSLPPAHLLEVGPEISVDTWPRRYWNALSSRERWSDSPSTSADRLRTALECAIADRVGAEDQGPIGILLSGGLDSTSIGALAARRCDEIGGSAGLVACTYAFDRLTECDETALAGLLATRHDFPMVRIDVEREWLLQDNEAFRPDLDSPFMAWPSVTRRVMRTLRERGASVLLTGHGGDNMVGGSPLAYASLLRRGRLDWIGQARNDARRRGVSSALLIWSSAIRPLLPHSAAHAARRLTGRGPAWRPPPWIDLGLVNRSGLGERTTSARGEGRYKDPAVRAARAEALVLGSVGRAASDFDRLAAPFGIAVRHPFLDRRVVEAVLSIPPEHHYNDGMTKSSLRRAMKADLPRVIVERIDKTSFSPYLDHSLCIASAEKVRDLLTQPIAAELGLIDGEILRKGHEAYCAGNLPKAGKAIWAALTLERWLQEHAEALD